MTSHRLRSFILIYGGLTLLLLLAAAPFVLARGPAPAEAYPAVDAYVAEQMAALEIPGMAIAIVQGDQMYAKGYGVADATGRAVTAQTPFLIASLSKSFTAFSIMQLTEAGRIGLDDPVQMHLPWFQVADPATSAQVTVRQLLHQTSGFSEREGYIRNLETDRGDDALEASVRRLRASKMKHPAGMQFEYSNTNYDLLGLLIQSVTGRSYESYVLENIFARLGMTNSYASLVEAQAGGVSSGHYPFFGFPLVNDRFMPYSRTTIPSAGLFASAEDMARYLSVHLNDGVHQNTTLMSAEGIAELFAPGPEIGEGINYAMGWVRFPFTAAAPPGAPPEDVPTAISHGGDWAGFMAIMLLMPERDLGIVALMNKSDQSQSAAFSNIGWNLALLALGQTPVDFPVGDFITRNGRLMLLGLLLLLALGAAWSFRRLSRWPRETGLGDRSRRRLIGIFVVFAIVDMILVGYLLVVWLPQTNDTLRLALRFQPDTGLIYVALLALTIGWGTIRTIWMLKNARKAQT